LVKNIRGIWVNFQEIDIKALGIKPGRKLEVKIKVDAVVEKTVNAYYGTSGDSFDVNIPRDEWMIWIDAQGFIVLCKNTSLVLISNAAATFGIQRGTRVFMKAIAPPLPKKLDTSRFADLLGKK